LLLVLLAVLFVIFAQSLVAPILQESSPPTQPSAAAPGSDTSNGSHSALAQGDEALSDQLLSTWDDNTAPEVIREDDAEMIPALPLDACPLPLPEPTSALSYCLLGSSEVWRADTVLPCKDYARAFLLLLRGSSFLLVHASYLDLSGDNWGCVLRGEDGASYITTIRTGKDSSGNATTRVTVVHILMPEGGEHAQD
jgi:hypothetical protein